MRVNIKALELSTQLVVEEAWRRGVDVEILDEESNFIRLRKGDRVQILRQATKTALDSYIAAQIMENKEVTKLLLREGGIRVPQGIRIHDVEEGLERFEEFKTTSVVVKPLSTNFGVGVVVFQPLETEEEFKEALEYAFLFDETVMVEEYIPGKEYRFLVMGDEVVAVLHREPANVVGDGASTVQQLVAAKNEDPLRGSGYVTPLEKIKLGEVEAAFLKKQSFTFDSILPQGQKVYLRENSNISTGGDSLDFTDKVHPGYKELALRCAKLVGAAITGADVMIQDTTAPPSRDNYGVIELNFNPAIHMHNHPYIGENRGVEKKLLDLLGF
ncbi:bifunctional glutamate--cysteine ligase GshA/glutathione synthetase GshB [Alkalibacter rhizosphaerae]|uniref:Bifunctional glutamate--cysteine ligase GshA/glutathione synthetase GshB n=2 Tax=Alkalibacter rhizosphaerae TaxID=2815577 RepID=A0A974XJQ6_9FIRM|nr:bifunctional glutamate--cysteine ligase GshA/glutathione synthetase GshB [Alkalibacter rhizosphaerae]